MNMNLQNIEIIYYLFSFWFFKFRGFEVTFV